ncbi:MAG TPA: DUF4391 domain-containing protein [Phycisphaerales bacterium]|nr:DUF4391 domain-containing protein [Phycisphaerales bacterium]
MTADEVIAACGLPSSALVGQRVPKKLLVEHGAATGTDKKSINDLVDELHWTAALKPTTVGLAAYRDDAREVLEVAVLTLTLRAGASDAKAARLTELVHRAIPYPLLLIASGMPTGPRLSLVDKRWSQGESGKTVLDGDVHEVRLGELPTALCQQLLPALALTARPRPHLYALYRGWMDAFTAVDAARLTTNFRVPATPEEAAERRAALLAVSVLESRMASLRSLATKERQTSRLVELNLELQLLQSQHREAIAKL